MKAIFNSLGSNYSLSFALEAFGQIFFSSNKSIVKLHEYLDEYFSGESYLFYKGRDAIEFCFKTLFEDGEVLTQAFSCYAVEEGIKRAGLKPVYVDVDENSTNMTVKTLSAAFKKTKKARAVLVQHSLGIPAEIEQIKTWCEKNNLLLVEDLAQSFGATDGRGVQLGTLADAIILSFGRDKIVDAISGGATIFKNLDVDQSDRAKNFFVSPLPKSIFFKEMIYPITTYFGKVTYDLFLGRLILKMATMVGIIDSPTITKVKKASKIEAGYANLALRSLSNLHQRIKARKIIAKHYLNNINNKKITVVNTEDDIEHGTNLRFSIRTENVDALISELKNSNIFLHDRWYRNPVDCGKSSCSSVYENGSAKNAEKLAKEVVNLPTHQYITLKKADRIIELLNNF